MTNNDDLTIENNEMTPMVTNLISKTPIKLCFFIFITYLFLSSDIYLDFLETFGIVKVSSTSLPNSFYIMNGIIIIIIFLIINMLIQNEII